MKTCNSIFFALFFAAFALTTGCSRDNISFDQKEPVLPEGYGQLSFENLSLDVTLDSETIVTEPSSATRAQNEASEDYVIRIYNSAKEEVYTSTYGEINALPDQVVSLEQGTYRISAESPNFATQPLAAWSAPVYFDDVYADVITRKTTYVDDLICRLGNIKTSVALSADLKNIFRPDGEGTPLTTTLSIGEGSLEFGRNETREGFFKAIEEENTLKITLKGEYNKAAADETPSYVPITWTQEIKNVRAGQWRKVSINILHTDEGNVQFEVTVETWVYDEQINVDIMSANFAFNPYEEVIPDQEISDKDAPEVKFYDGSSIEAPFVISSASFDDFGEPTKQFDITITPQGNATLSTVDAMITSDNTVLLERIAAAGWVENTVSIYSAVATADATDYYQYTASGTGIRFRTTDAGMQLLYQYAGTHVVKYIAVDSEGRRSFTELTITVSSTPTGAGPAITWSQDEAGTDLVDMSKRHEITPSTTLGCYINISSKTGITGLIVDIDSKDLNDEVLSEMQLSTHMDLLNPTNDDMDSALNGLGFKTKKEVEGKNSIQFNITQFLPMLAGVTTGETTFILKVTDAEGTTEGRIQLVVK